MDDHPQIPMPEVLAALLVVALIGVLAFGNC